MAEIISDADEPTPVQRRGGLLFKREDLYAPFGSGDVNGGKARQCCKLLEAVGPSSVYTACSIHSPQAPIVAAFARARGVPATILYGGTSADRLRSMQMPRLCMAHGAKLVIAARTGRHNVLGAIAHRMADEAGGFVVDYGINVERYPGVMLDAVSRQVENLPDEAPELHMVCGSGITASGVLLGIKRCRKRIGKAVLYATAPDRSERLRGNVGRFPCEVEVVDLFHRKGFVYERREPLTAFGISFHPNYEAKMMRELLTRRRPPEGSVVWVVGAEPSRCFR